MLMYQLLKQYLHGHNYPLPDDDETMRTVAMQEVEANVRSHKSYIEEFGKAEDAAEEFDRIIEEIGTIQNTQNMMADYGDLGGAQEDDYNNE